MEDKNLKKLDEIRKLKHNWNMYGASPIPKEVIELTEKMIKELPFKHKLEIFPTTDDRIQLEYEKGGNTEEYLEVLVGKKSTEIYREIKKRLGSVSNYEYEATDKLSKLINTTDDDIKNANKVKIEFETKDDNSITVYKSAVLEDKILDNDDTKGVIQQVAKYINEMYKK